MGINNVKMLSVVFLTLTITYFNDAWSADFSTVTSATGRVWMDRNLGASQVAQSSTDPEAYGDLYQWGRGTDGHEKRNSPISSVKSDNDNPNLDSFPDNDGKFITSNGSPYDWRVPQNSNLWQGVSGINNPCPSGFRLPTDAEWETERLSWNSNDSNGAYNSPLKLVAAGYRSADRASLLHEGGGGYYWSNTTDGSNSSKLDFNSSGAYLASYYRGRGFSVRCISDDQSSLVNGLIAYYEFEGNANDYSGNGNDGYEYGGVTYVEGISGQAASFDGVNDYIDLGTVDFPSNPYSFAAWIKTNTLSGPQTVIGYRYDAAPFNWRIMQIFSTSWEVGFAARGGTDQGMGISTSPGTITAGKWHFLVGTYDGTNGVIYIDGEGVATGSASTGTIADTVQSIGRRSGDNIQYFGGIIDEVRIYNRALNSTEVKTLHNYHSDIAPIELSQSTPTKAQQATSTYNVAFDGRTLTCGSPGPVVASSGNYTHTHNDFTIPSLGPNLNITRYYNSQDLYDGPFGHGWNMDYSAQLVIAEEQDGTTYATVRLGNGVRRKFTVNSDNTFTAPTGQDDTLHNAGTFETPVYIFNGECGSDCTPKPRTAYTFNAGGWLTAISDRNGNQLTVSNDGVGRVGTVTDANGRDLTFSYGTNGRVESLSDFSGRSWDYGYDTNDNLTSVTDPLNNTIQYHYDENHNLTAVIDALGNTVASVGYGIADKADIFTDNGGSYQLSYDPVSQVTSKTNPAGGLFQFEYDNNGNITNKSGPHGKSLAMTWDADVNLSSKVNGRDIITDYSYDANHNVTGIVHDAGSGNLNLTTAYQYDPLTGQISQITDPRGNITVMTYDTSGNLTEQTMPIGASQYVYDASGLPTISTDPDGIQTGYEFDANGYLIRTWVVGTDPVVQTSYTYDALGNLLTQTDPTGNFTSYLYDDLNQVTSVEDALHNIISFQYDANSNLTRMIDARGLITDFTYDQYNRLINRTEAVGSSLERSTSYSYDIRGNLLSVTDPLNHITSYTYDELNRQTQACDHLNQCWSFTYDETDNLSSKTDPNNNTTSYSYDAVGRLSSVSDAEGHITSYNYDANGNLLTVTDANNHIAITNVYDENNRLISNKDALNFTSSRTFSDAGRIVTETDANGEVITYVYDSISGQLTEIQYPTSRVQDFTYDLAGRLLSISDSGTGVTIDYTYDALGRVVTENQLGQTLTYNYDENGNRIELALAGVGSTIYNYDDLNRLASIVNPESETTAFTYNAGDLISQITYGNSSYTNYSYDGVNRLTLVSHHQADDTMIAAFGYSYDGMNNRQTEVNSSGTITYSYDKTYKLLSASYPDSETISFTYDPVGNRLSRIDAAGTTTYSYDNADRLTAESNTDSSSISYTWDSKGNILTQTKTNSDSSTELSSYSYDILGLLTRLDLPDGTINTYTYDPVGRRIMTSDGSIITRYLYDGKNPLADINGDDATPVYQTFYTPALGLDVLASRKQGTDTQYFLRDGLNSVRLVLNSDETVAAAYEYQSYGGIRGQTGSSDNLFTFTGRRAEGNNELMYYRTRYYDPTVGRFLKKDSYAGNINDPLSLHRYGYVLNNPVNWVDPMGEHLSPVGLNEDVVYASIIGVDEYKRQAGLQTDTLLMYHDYSDTDTTNYEKNLVEKARPSSDQCGSTDWSWLTPDTFGRVDMKKACARHDQDYLMQRNKIDADISLGINIIMDNPLEPGAYVIGPLYSIGVMIGGGDTYDNTKSEWSCNL